jgi:hypothetical protein
VNLLFGEINLAIISIGTEPIIPNNSISKSGSNPADPINS